MHNVKHYLFLDGEQRGPYTFSQLQGMWRNGAVTSETMHFMDGYADWMPLEVIVQDLEPPLPPPMRAYHAAPSPRPMVVAKSRGVYIILALFLGGLFGIHNFYAGRFGIAVAQLLITIFTGWLILPLLAVVVWVLIECIVVTTDGNGNPMG